MYEKSGSLILFNFDDKINRDFLFWNSRLAIDDMGVGVEFVQRLDDVVDG